MVVQTIAEQPFSDVGDGLVTESVSEVVAASFNLADAEGLADPLRSARGVLFGLLLCAPLWSVVSFWLLW
jgi:hypothetical protein